MDFKNWIELDFKLKLLSDKILKSNLQESFLSWFRTKKLHKLPNINNQVFSALKVLRNNLPEEHFQDIINYLEKEIESANHSL